MKRLTKQSLLSLISNILSDEHQMYEACATLFGDDSEESIIRRARYEACNEILLIISTNIKRRKTINYLLETLNQIYCESLILAHNYMSLSDTDKILLQSQYARLCVTSKIIRNIITAYPITEVHYDSFTTTW